MLFNRKVISIWNSFDSAHREGGERKIQVALLVQAKLPLSRSR